jgi:hypothetical protein
MKLITVQSTNISQIGFEKNKVMALNQRPINILRIVFAGGNIFDYYNVEKEVYESFLDSESKGKYFHKFIKSQYQYEKVN